ncbi:MAG: Rid family detoxifying hydrolase [Fermentimonas sp.]|jgi:2-iminobutanoate/2-iminopropanoate deaminase|nr:Rid family detoxifying hydrolase [Fermentimonas sp.]NLC86845.1 reactive intermediate/imine deaminase [Bacteroidales bacterium]HBT84633.1 reactive intermediate/imine deaminase [Porphyromonadaceae bacterium]MDD2930600.1 Rid family detoxifying hydrolase [Fermentimonas sp.]MDD3188272.1 Rid family detoxifying hydrolase [Fermentimonas sp.]
MKKIISTKNAPEAIGPYSQAVEVNGMLFLSGMLPIDPTTGSFVPGGVKEQTAQIFINIKAVLSVAEMNIGHVVKTTVYLNDMSLFDGMNQVYASQFKDVFPARSTIAVKSLPKNALVEIEVIAFK